MSVESDCKRELKILVSAVQSRSCPPFLSGSCTPPKSSRASERAHFVPIASSLSRILAHLIRIDQSITSPPSARIQVKAYNLLCGVVRDGIFNIPRRFRSTVGAGKIYVLGYVNDPNGTVVLDDNGINYDRRCFK